MRVAGERYGNRRIRLEEMITGRWYKASHVTTSTDISLSMYRDAYRHTYLYKCIYLYTDLRTKFFTELQFGM